ncbi:MAG: 3'-5' exonuclease [Bacteroidales bacterium]|nr:3'-5' exonuclease [Bacteroidales bacterium]MCF8457109.1 3'-5' exonuclease [Bacteroidales bacterium]
MLEKIPLENIIFLDIETVPQCGSYSDVPDNFKALWEKKSSFFRSGEQSAEDVYQRAGIYAEFGKIVCISVGLFIPNQSPYIFRVKSFYGDDEAVFLAEFNKMLDSVSQKKNILLCAHNGKEFDFPYIARRSLINGLRLPTVLDIAGKKPWEINHLDTLELWKFGDYKNYTSLNMLMAAFNIPSPKDDIDGSMVASVYYQEKNLERIVRYCEKDVVAIARLFLKYRCEKIFGDEHVESVTVF